VASGVVAHRDEAFERWLHNDSPFYVRHYAPDPADAVRLVRDAGGVAVLAHPFVSKPQRFVPRELVVELSEVGLAGLEARHPDHDERARRHAGDLAAELGMFVTGSSDYHGSGKTTRLGQEVTTATVLAEIERRATGASPVR
jgi:predicted metal-dependent phosphoesterase TrpH